MNARRWGFGLVLDGHKNGNYVLLTDHERVVREHKNQLNKFIAEAERTFGVYEADLAASRAEVDGLTKDAERYRWLREKYNPSIHDAGFEPLFSLTPENLDYEIDVLIDAAMEKSNENQDQ